jgi:phospholipid/cholesterol/gamma-HCH transport system permease protein
MRANPKPSTAIPVLQRGFRDGRPLVELSGAWNLRALGRRLEDLDQELTACAQDPKALWDARNIQWLDDAGALLLWRVWGWHRPDVLMKPEHEPIFARMAGRPAAKTVERRDDPARVLLVLGTQLLSLFEQLHAIILLAGELVLDVIQLVRYPLAIPWREILANIHRTGGQALPITALVGFLVGVVLSYLSARQLQAYGANIFIINILGIGIVRELGPMLAAVLIAGRSGSAMTAQLGVMRLTQELDALSVMGISHTLRLVLPKVIALAITMPLLILWTNSIALVGGMLAAKWQLGISYRQFLLSLPNAVPISNFWLSLGKGTVFGVLIALIACHYGLRIKPNTESLGAGTTESVVTAITVVIVVDAIFAVIFADIGFR